PDGPVGRVPPTDRLLAVRQIAGPMARTIVNEVAPGRRLAGGECFGMIKFGSRTELYFRPDAGYRLVVPLGARVLAGVTPLLRAPSPVPAPETESAPALP